MKKKKMPWIRGTESPDAPKAPSQGSPESQQRTAAYCRELLNRRSYGKAFRLLSELAQENDGEAAYLLSQLYDRGDGVTADQEQAAIWLQKAAGLSYPPAQFRYAMTIAPFSHGGEFSYRLCAEYLEKAAAGGHPQAMLELARLYFTGRGVENSKSRAYDLIRQAAEADPSISSDEQIGSCLYANVELAAALPHLKKAYNQGHYEICGILSSYYMRGIAGVEQDVETAFGILKQGANHRNGLSEYIIGCHYRDESNYPRARAYLQSAYDHNVMEAAYDLANVIMKTPDPSRRDMRTAFKMLSKAASYPTVRHYDALGDLGTCYHEGWGTEQDHEEAVRCFSMTLKNSPDNKASLLGLGYCYLNGTGIGQDREYGLELIRKAASKGVIPAGELLYGSYSAPEEDRRYVKSFSEYLSWLTVAADNGDPQACRLLGNLYLAGEKVPRDNRMAEKYLARAAELLDRDAMRQVIGIAQEQEDADPMFISTFATALVTVYGESEWRSMLPQDPEERSEAENNVRDMLLDRLRIELPLPSERAAALLEKISQDETNDLLLDLPIPQELP